ncbi:MAG TPA: HEAT repeat domain-containing protein [Caulobacteraceae bacterium]|nr:HEAT repeat domain-containing protein [Caulobacteraceae bacterium]
MSPLAFLWTLAVGLMTFSLATMVALISARVVRKQGRERRAARRAIVLPELVHHIGGLTGDSVDLAGLEGDAVLMAEVVRDLAGLVKGAERTRLMKALQALKVDATLRRLLRRGWTNHRVLAAEALVFFPSEETYEALHEASRDGAMRVRVSALRTAIELGRAPPVDEMLDGVARGSERASLLFSDLLQRATPSQITAAIVALDREDLPRHVRIMVLQALGATGDARALAPLRDAASSPDPEIRAGAFAALSALGHPGAQTVVADGLADPDWRVRLKAIECVRRLGLIDFFAQVMACAEDEVWWVRHRAGQTLMSLAHDDVAKLKEFAKRAARQLRTPAASASPPPSAARAAP